jgi:type VI secretion system protein ImpA
VVRLLECICAYYEKYEPSSPVPLLLTRAKRLVSKNFIDALRDIAPDAVAQAEAVRGRDAP